MPWAVRVVPNLYPALRRQEVVVHTARHSRSLAELSGEELDLVAEAWRRRRVAEPRGYLHASINEGAAAGASLAHSHSQLAWLPEVPPLIQRERGPPRRGSPIVERGGLILECPWASRVPYELVIRPIRAERGGFGSGLLAPALRLLGEAMRRLRAVEGPVAWNAWLHDGSEWHLEIFPRLSVLAALELGAGVFVNTLPPEHAAEALRAVDLPEH